MPTVNTIRGPVDAAELGPTLMHEHLVVTTPGIAENWPDLHDHEAAIRTTKGKLRDMASRGIRTLVDFTTPDLGRDVRVYVDLQDGPDVNIIVCTGVTWMVPLYWWFQSADELAAAFVGDIVRGIQGSSIKAGIIKIASDDQMPGPPGSPDLNEKCLRAAARAHRATGTPISTHTGPPSLGVDQQRVFREEGVDLSRVVIGHTGDTTDVDLLKRLMDEGSTVGLDRFGYDDILPLEDRIDTVAALCSAGYADRVVLSHDAIAATHWAIDRVHEPTPTRESAFNLISDEVLPALRRREVDEVQIDQILVKNPRRIFERRAAY